VKRAWSSCSSALDQARTVAIALDAEAIAIVLNLAKLLGAGGHSLADRGQATLELGAWSENRSSRP